MSRSAVSIFVAAFILGQPAYCKGKDDVERASLRHASEVKSFLEEMRKGAFKSRELPKFGEQHIPSLLSYSREKDLLKSFPVNWLSSFAQRKCSTGMVALWLVEGIRKADGKSLVYPSLNPLCLKKGRAKGLDWEEHSLQNQPAVAAAYAEWWQSYLETRNRSDFQSNPLEGTGLHWH